MDEPSRAAPATAPAPSAAVKWAAYLGVPLVLALVLTLIAEGVVRARQWSRLGTASSFTDLYRTDPAMDLRVLVPGARVGRIAVNSAGFRGPEITQPKPDGALRIAFLGASTTFCAEVSSNDEVWPQLVTEDLRRRFPGALIDFVNAGVPGYTVESMRKILRHRVAALKPDLIVVYEATNELSAEVRRRALAEKVIDSPVAHHPGWLERHSLLWELVVKNMRVRSAQAQPSTSGMRKLTVDPSSLGGSFRTDLSALLREARATGAHVAVVTFATHLRPGQSEEQSRRAAVSALVYMPFMTIDGLLAGYARYNDVIREVARTEGATLIGGEDSVPGDPQHFADSVHFNDAGSRAQARRVADALAGDPAVQALLSARQRRP